ncbi:MAG: PA2779 family protein, partial [Steroidobacteraceae bacterium]|nr:PA2779 family protein [Steroidobacteraceae bacterium]
MQRCKSTPRIALLCLLMLAGQMTATGARAEVIGTAAAIAAQTRELHIDRVRAALDREIVRAELTRLGVDRADLDARIAALSDVELAQLAADIDRQPAGGVLEVLGIVLIVLLVLEYTGAIDIFKRVP